MKEPSSAPIIVALHKVSATSANVWCVEIDADGQRLDNYLFTRLKGVPKTHIYRIIRSGEIRINKARAKAHTKLVAGDEIRVPPMRVAEKSEVKSTIPKANFSILFEDEHFLAINKPAGTAVHGGSGVSFGVIEQLRQARPLQSFLELVHRLDRETSGVLLIAKKRAALLHLQEQFKNRQTKKIYLALVLGDVLFSHKIIDKALHKYTTQEGDRRVVVVDQTHPQAMRAISSVRLIDKGVCPSSWVAAHGLVDKLSLVEVNLKTGRTHQIRVHLASCGHPIAGDDKYGNFEFNKQIEKCKPTPLSRMFLHAWRFSCEHPATGEPLSFQAELPIELTQFINQIMPTLQDDMI